MHAHISGSAISGAWACPRRTCMQNPLQVSRRVPPVREHLVPTVVLQRWLDVEEDLPVQAARLAELYSVGPCALE